MHHRKSLRCRGGDGSSSVRCDISQEIGENTIPTGEG